MGNPFQSLKDMYDAQNAEIELIKESDPEKVAAWDRLHNKRKTYRCHRCGAEWKCEYGANKFSTSHEHNGDPDILCQCCGLPTVKEVVMRGTAESIIISTPTNSAVKKENLLDFTSWCEFKEEEK